MRAYNAYTRPFYIDLTPAAALARPPSAASATSPSMQAEASGAASLASRYQLKRKATWSVAGEVASLAPVLDSTGKRVVLVGQQSGRCVPLHF